MHTVTTTLNNESHHSDASGRILLVEDDPDVAMMVRQFLMEDALAVLTVGTGEEGLDAFDAQQVDLVILDALLPGMSGWDFCRRVKELQPRPYVPILMLTGRASLQDRVHSLEAGADDYLAKPFDINELLAHVHAMLRIRQAEIKLWHYTRELETINEIATAVSSSLDLDEVLSLAIERVVRISEACLGAIWLADRFSPTLRLAAHAGIPPEEISAIQRLDRSHTLIHRVIDAGGTVTVTGPEEAHPLAHASPNLVATAYLPLISKGTRLGLLALGGQSMAAFGPRNMTLLSALASTIAVAADNARLFAQVRHHAITDPITELYNHRYMQDIIEHEVQRSNRSARPFSIMMIDLDGFKRINDTLGHPAGDVLLRRTGEMLSNACRRIDTVGRYGGDEFIIVLPDTTVDQAATVAGRLLLAAHEAVSPDPDVAPMRLSIGIAVYPHHAVTRQELISKADNAMYRAKQQGGARYATAFRAPPP